MAKKLYEIENRKRNNKIVNVIKTGLSDLKDKIEEMSKHEKKIEQPNKILKIVEKLLSLTNKIKRTKNTNMKPYS